MSLSVDWSTQIIYVPQADLSPLGGGVYELDLDWFRAQILAIEASAEGIVQPSIHRHNTTVTLGGVTLARTIEIINGYTVEFEDGQYAVNLVGANTNIADVLVVNQVSTRSFNTAGLVVSGSGVTQGDKDDIAALVLDELLASGAYHGTLAEAVWDALTAGSMAPGSFGELLNLGFSPSQLAMVLDIWRRHGLDPSNPLVSDRAAGTIDAGPDLIQAITTIGTTDTITRAP